MTSLRVYPGQPAIGTVQIGVTSDLIKRVWQHKEDCVRSFTKQYHVHLVWFEQHAAMEAAIQREKAREAWKGKWKIRLIETSNPSWRHRYHEILQG